MLPCALSQKGPRMSRCTLSPANQADSSARVFLVFCFDAYPNGILCRSWHSHQHRWPYHATRIVFSVLPGSCLIQNVLQTWNHGSAAKLLRSAPAAPPTAGTLCSSPPTGNAAHLKPTSTVNDTAISAVQQGFVKAPPNPLVSLLNQATPGLVLGQHHSVVPILASLEISTAALAMLVTLSSSWITRTTRLSQLPIKIAEMLSSSSSQFCISSWLGTHRSLSAFRSRLTDKGTKSSTRASKLSQSLAMFWQYLHPWHGRVSKSRPAS